MEEFFSYEWLNARKEEKFEYWRATYEKRIRFAVEFFVLRVDQFRKSKDFFADELHTRASTGKSRKPLSSPGLVYRHKKGTWESQEKKRKEKKKTKEGEKVAPAKARFRVPYTKNSFFSSRVFGFRSGPSWLKYQLLRDLVYEEAMCKRSSGNRLLYAAKAVP